MLELARDEDLGFFGAVVATSAHLGGWLLAFLGADGGASREGGEGGGLCRLERVLAVVVARRCRRLVDLTRVEALGKAHGLDLDVRVLIDEVRVGLRVENRVETRRQRLEGLEAGLATTLVSACCRRRSLLRLSALDLAATDHLDLVEGGRTAPAPVDPIHATAGGPPTEYVGDRPTHPLVNVRPIDRLVVQALLPVNLLAREVRMLLDTRASAPSARAVHDRVDLAEAGGSAADSLRNGPRRVTPFIAAVARRGPIPNHHCRLMVVDGGGDAGTAPAHIEGGRTGRAPHEHLARVMVMITTARRSTCVVEGGKGLLAPLSLASGAPCRCIAVLRVDVQVGTGRRAEVRVSGLGPLPTTRRPISTLHLRLRLPINLGPVEILQVLVAKLALVLEVARA